jgi:Protein of unknown function (DUF3300)
MNFFQRLLAGALCLCTFVGTMPQEALARPLGSGFGFQEVYAPLSDSDLDALVAPIALYPDALVAQALGAATFPDQVVDANNFLKANPSLSGAALQKAIESKSWDPAVQALTQFSTVLNTLATNITWTSALGDASATQQEATLAAVQRMRAKAYAAGNLTTGKEIKVVQQSPQVIVIQPANPQVVYVPSYNPTVVYGAPVTTPGYSSGDVAAAAIISFGVGIAVGAAMHNSSCGYSYWGWGMSWGVRTISCGGSYYYGNPYWRGGYYPGYGPGYRPPYYPAPRPPYPGYRPPYYPPGGGGRPPYPGYGPRPTPLPSQRPTTLPATRPATGGASTLPAPTPRPTPAAPGAKPGTKELRGYPQNPPPKAATAARPNAFSGSGGGRPQSARGNQSMGGSRKRG